MSLLHLVRHGQASAGTDNYDRLSDIGREQSRLLGRWWLSQGFSPNEAYHGSLIRQRDTASLSLQALKDNGMVPPMREHAGLNEYNHRVVESHFASSEDDYKPESMSFEDYMGILQRWRDHKAEDSVEGVEIEPWADFKARGWNTLQTLSHHGDESSEFVFFTSGGVIATVLSTVLDLDFEHTVDAIWRIRNASVSTFHVTKTSARLVEFNNVAHLQQQCQPYLITLI